MTHNPNNTVDEPTGQAPSIFQIAFAYLSAGLSLIPIKPDGSKAPESTLLPWDTLLQKHVWKPYQGQLPSHDELINWFAYSSGAGIAIIGGAISGNLEIIDLDAPAVCELWREMLEEIMPGLLRRLPCVLTPRQGWHVYYRCEVIEGNLKLARSRDGNTLIETRGDGGYVIAPGSPLACHPLKKPYQLIRGDLTQIPTITPDARQILLNTARSFNEFPQKRVYQAQASTSAHGERPGDLYNARAGWDELMHAIGATATGTRGDATLWKRPGKTTPGHSAITGNGDDMLYVFSSNFAPFEPETAYDRFGAYTTWFHGGDFSAAAKELFRQGYGRNGNDQPQVSEPPYHRSEHGDDQQEAEQEIHDDPKYKPIGPYLIKWSAVKGNALYYRKPGTTDDQQLANFMAWIIEERLEDDGAESLRMVTMEATLTSGKQFPEIKIAVPEFYSLAGLMKALGTEAVVSPGPMVKDRIRHAIQLYSNRQTYPQRHVFTHLGWRKVDGVWCYLHAGGSIPAKAEVSVDKALQRYILPQTTSAQAALKASLRVLECAPKRLTIPLLSMVYLAPLAEWLEPDVTGWLEGPSGAQKSSLVALIICHYGYFSRVHPPDTWESTANTLERLAFLAKDILLWVDDYAPQPSAKEMHEQERKAQRVIRAQGNLAGRGRMRADTSLRPQYYPRGVILSTGELHPTGTSTFARLLQLDVAKGDINLETLTTSQAEAHLLAEAMVAYVGWLQPQLDTLPAILKARWNELRTDALPRLTHHSRHPEVYAHLATAWELFLRCACAFGAIDEAERQMYWNVGSETLMNAINRQRLDAEAEDPVHRFCSHIKEAIIQGKAYLDDVRGGYPEDAGQWGWTMQDEWKPSQGASMLGWIDQDFLYLLPDAAYRLVFENLQRAGVILLPQQTLWKRLVDRGYVQRGENRYTTRKRIGSDRPHVLKVVRRFVEDHLSPQSGDSGDNEDS